LVRDPFSIFGSQTGSLTRCTGINVIMSSGIDPMSGEPVYRQLAAIIRSKIESGEYPPGTPLPSAKSMSQEYGISAGAVTRAVASFRLRPHRDVRQVVRSHEHLDDRQHRLGLRLIALKTRTPSAGTARPQ
jgi:DNA-binding transcriptional MocR family regulator